MPSILVPARAQVQGEIRSRSPAPVTAAAPASAAPARNLRRFRYKLLGVTSDERMSCAFLISMGTSYLYTRSRRKRIYSSLIFIHIGRYSEEKVAKGFAEPDGTQVRCPARQPARSRRYESEAGQLPQHFPHLARQILQGKRLLQECGALLNRAIAENGIFGIPGEIKNFGLRTRLGQLPD